MTVLFYIFVALAEIVFVGLVLIAFTTWPLWREYRKLKREYDAKAREILERWRPLDPPRTELSFLTMKWLPAVDGVKATVRNDLSD